MSYKGKRQYWVPLPPVRIVLRDSVQVHQQQWGLYTPGTQEILRVVEWRDVPITPEGEADPTQWIEYVPNVAPIE